MRRHPTTQPSGPALNAIPQPASTARTRKLSTMAVASMVVAVMMPTVIMIVVMMLTGRMHVIVRMRIDREHPRRRRAEQAQELRMPPHVLGLAGTADMAVQA